jgi:hypothetical protein
MSKTAVAEKEMTQWTPEEKKETSSRYGCEILFERATLAQVKDPSLPSDAYLIFYRVDNETYMDLCRGRRVKVFDLYYDKFGPGSVQKIDFGYGRVSPRVWGYKAPDGKKKK